MLRLHNFHSSSTSFRVRIGLNLKGLAFEYVPVTLRWKDGDHDRADFKELNPQGNVPVLVDRSRTIAQSLAILEYLEEMHPEPALLPREAEARAHVRSLALHVACEIQPPNNLRVERHLANVLDLDPSGLKAWRRHWIRVGFDAVERMLRQWPATGRFCHGDTPGLADCVLVPQVYNARRPVVDLDISTWPSIARIYEACLAHPAIDKALPRNQPDWEEIKEH